MPEALEDTPLHALGQQLLSRVKVSPAVCLGTILSLPTLHLENSGSFCNLILAFLWPLGVRHLHTVCRKGSQTVRVQAVNRCHWFEHYPFFLSISCVSFFFLCSGRFFLDQVWYEVCLCTIWIVKSSVGFISDGWLSDNRQVSKVLSCALPNCNSSKGHRPRMELALVLGSNNHESSRRKLQ